MTQVLDPVWIELSDGCRLAARVWLPDDAGQRRYPTILEAIPYRRTDGTLTIDDPRYRWWAQRGFAGVRVDLRGSGDSDGLLYDEYLRQEQDDDLEVLAWIADQPWSNGRVGMIGYSWGGFSGLQVAARAPSQLGAVVTVNSTVRRYTDDCHYIGGAVNAHDMLSWATTMLAFDARPPDPEVVGERWREMWERRLDVAPPMIEPWLAHQLEDEYWRHGSVSFQYDAITCPVLAVGGWSDPYRNAVLDLVANLTGRCFGLIGPWAHGYPHDTPPGPNIAFLAECERFFGRYLRDDDNRYDDEPSLRAYVQSYDRPAAHQQRRSGRWVAVADWSPSAAAPLELALGVRSLASDAPVDAGAGAPLQRVGSAQANGLAAGNWCPYGGPSQPLDQRGDDSLSLCLDSEPLGEAVEILGFPELAVRLQADRPAAILAARLCDVAPTGESLLVTRGILNLTHREGHDAVVPLTPGEPVDVRLRLDCAGHRFAPGHRIRLALSPCYWPWVWPSPEPATLSFEIGRSHLTLPMLGAHARYGFDAADEVEPVAIEWVTQGPFSQMATHDVTNGRVQLASQADFLSGRRRIVELGLEAEDWGENVYRIDEHDPLSAEVVCRRRAGLGRPGWEVRVEADARMRASAAEFVVETELRAFEGGRLLSTRRFTTVVPRRD
ncbi:MAG: CocE/NonD family hydrolase [Solirubrobacteraceae bacterium]